jgi:predicted transcriptional regulator
MKFSDYLNNEQLSNSEFARRIGVNASTVLRLVEGNVPRPETMLAIYKQTCGQVEPIDWYPAILQERERMRSANNH